MWTDANNGATNHVIYRRTENGAWVKVGSVGMGKTKFRDATAQAGVKYFYRLYAYSVAGRSPASATASAIVMMTSVPV